MGKKKEKKEEVQKTTLEKLIPTQNINLYLKIYDAMKNTKFRGLKEFPVKEISAIDKNLMRLYEMGWFEKEDLLFLMDSLLGLIYESKDGDNFQEAVVKTEIRKVGSPSHYAFNFLIYALIFDLKYFTKKPHYDKVIDFLVKQKIIHTTEESKVISREELRKRFKRLKFLEVAKSLVYASRIAGTEKEMRLGQITREYYEKQRYKGFFEKFFKSVSDIDFQKIDNCSVRGMKLSEAVALAMTRIEGYLYQRENNLQ